MMTISEDFLFRLEKFGGILINKVTFDRIELDSRTFSSSLDIFGTPFEYDTLIIFLFNTYNKIFPYLHFLTTS